MAECLKPIPRCVEVGVHVPACRCALPAEHDSFCQCEATLRLFPSLRVKES